MLGMWELVSCMLTRPDEAGACKHGTRVLIVALLEAVVHLENFETSK